MTDWARDSTFYHIYPLGLTGAPAQNDFASPPQPRLAEIVDWIGHLRELGVTALYLGPLFESTAHGYDTADYFHVDRRLGDNRTLAELVAHLHSAGIRVILDAVFHHVGRDFWAFRDLQENGEQSAFRDWFAGVDFAHRSPNGDPFTYEAWNGHYDLVKLNLHHPDVRNHIFGAVRAWVEEFAIDGLRLDVAESIDPVFLRDLATFGRDLRPDFWLLGEIIHGDYRHLAGPNMLDSATNYEVYKGLYSSHNDSNYFEIAYSLKRQFGPGGMYRELPLYNFVDNHDVDRVVSVLHNPAHLYPLYALLFTIPGVPSIYYGSEWGLGGRKIGGDDGPLRPRLRPDDVAHAPQPDLAAALGWLAHARQSSPALRYGAYVELHVSHQQFAFARHTLTDYAVVAVNSADTPARLDLPVSAPDGRELVDLLDSSRRYSVRGGRLLLEEVPACGARILATQA
jgi:glycosidase